jgi:hypothetical protein
MEYKQLQSGLQQAFTTDRHRIVFWYGALGHFADSPSELALEGVQVINMAGELMLRLELEVPETPSLRYLPHGTLSRGRPITGFNSPQQRKHGSG